MDSGANATFSGLTITEGCRVTVTGGGLNNMGTATLTDCVVSGNHGRGYSGGGGIGNEGMLTLDDSTIDGNTTGNGRVPG